MELEGAKRLVLAPSAPNVHRADGGLDWSLVEAVCVIEVVDYHNR